MKKLFIALSIALLAVLLVAAPALAWGNENTEVECSDINVSDETPVVGSTVYYSGTVTITAESNACGFGSYASASSGAWYVIYNPNGVIVAQDYQPTYDLDVGLFGASADASQTYNWSVAIVMGELGEYLAQQGGYASAMYFTMFSPSYGSDGDSCSMEKIVATHNVVLLPSHPVLTIELPDKRHCFFPSDGWGKTITDNIVFTDGTWQVEIANGTLVQLDGKWHKLTCLKVDGQGGVSWEYGKSDIVAEEIGLSNPIAITKVS